MTVGGILGHKSVKTTEVYTLPSEEEMRKTLEKAAFESDD